VGKYFLKMRDAIQVAGGSFSAMVGSHMRLSIVRTHESSDTDSVGGRPSVRADDNCRCGRCRQNGAQSCVRC